MEIRAHAVGSRVKLGEHSSITAEVSGVTIRRNGVVLYEVFWWSGGDRVEIWVTSGELPPVAEGSGMTVRLSLQ